MKLPSLSSFKSGLVSYLSLFSSLSTLMCCAIPSFLVMLGFGGILASSVSSVPQLKWFGQHSNALFIFAGSMLAINCFLMFKSRNKPCDIKGGKACASSRKVSKIIFWVSVAIYIIALLGKLSYLLP